MQHTQQIELMTQIVNQNQQLLAMLQAMNQQGPDPVRSRPRMMVLSQASKEYGLSYQHLKKLIFERKIRFVPAGKRILINLDSLEEYMRRGEGGDQG